MSVALPSFPAQKGVPWTVGDIVKAVASAIIILMGLLVIVNLAFNVLGAGGEGRVALGLFSGVAVELALLGIAWRFSLWKYKCSWGGLGFRRFGPLALFLAGMVLLLGLVVNVVYVALVSLVDLKQLLPPPLPPTLRGDGLAWGGMALLAVAASPVAEETFFRGFVFGGLMQRLGLGWGVGGSSLLFALAHFQPGLFIPVLALGAMLALLYQTTGSLWLSIIVHGLYNGLALQLAFA